MTMTAVTSRYKPSTESPASNDEDELLGVSKAMRAISAYIDRLATTSNDVLITGEAGTGKELVARLIHRNSARARNALICINCADIPDTLVDNEFGQQRRGFVRAASGDGSLAAVDAGTVFLDQFGDMSSSAQAKILRSLKRRDIARFGGSKRRHIKIRVIASWSRNFQRISRGDFTRSPFFHGDAVNIHLPPLRERREDILPLAHHFRIKCNRRFGRHTFGFTQSAVELMLGHAWPGNVGEVRNVVEAAFINADPECRWLDIILAGTSSAPATVPLFCPCKVVNNLPGSSYLQHRCIHPGQEMSGKL